MRFVGLDLAWGQKAKTGVAVLDEHGSLVHLETVSADDEILDRLRRWAPDECVVAIDAPLIVENATGMRSCERLVGRYFNRFGIGCHPSNLANPAFADGGRAAKLARAMGLDVGPDSTAARRAIEVYPHTAIVQLFSLPRALRYKHKPGRDLALLQYELLQLIDHIEGLARAEPPLEVSTHPVWQQVRQSVLTASRKVDLKLVEDVVDAGLCAYIGLLAHRDRDRVRTLGGADGYIVTPVDEEMAQRIDAEPAGQAEKANQAAVKIAGRPARSDGPGHVFVTRGRLERFVHDAVVIPTDRAFKVERHWNPVLDVTTAEEVERLRPESWPDNRADHAPGAQGIWFLNVGRDRGEGVEWLADGVRQALEGIADQGLTPSRGRVRPLVVMPVVGIGRGGFANQRGEAIQAVLDAANQVSAKRGLDVAFVIHDRPAYAAVQHMRRQAANWPLEEDLLATAQELGRKAIAGELALFLGAGISIPAGLPSWSDLVDRGLERLGGSIDLKDAKDLTLLDQAELISRQNPEALRELVVAECDVPEHALSHALLSNLGCREVVTTNFDRCFELADADQHVSVLPWATPDPQTPWLLKMHGDVKHPDSIVLTRGDFAAYDAKYRPAASVLQALILTRHVMFVGASMTDDNVLRLAYEVSRLREDNKLPGHWGTVLDVGRSEAKKALYARELNWVTFTGKSTEKRARELEIFLDAVACFATSDASWLLDERFSVLLDEGGEVAQSLRSMARQVERLAGRNPAWNGILSAFRDHGA